MLGLVTPFKLSGSFTRVHEEKTWNETITSDPK